MEGQERSGKVMEDHGRSNPKYYRVSTKKAHFSFPVRRAKGNFFCGHPVDV